MPPIRVLLNQSAGLRSWEPAQIQSLFEQAGVDAQVTAVPPSELTSAARRAVREGVSAVVAAGGDGTVSAVAAVLAGSDVPLGILPVGTLNHFARDVGVPLDLPAAVRAIAAGAARRVDVGRVNRRSFINNCSLGLYPHVVRRREKLRQRLGRGKWFAMGVTVLAVFRRYPLVQVEIAAAGSQPAVRCKAPLVFIGNNRYEIQLMNLGRRTRLDGGELCVYLAAAPSRRRFLLLAMRALIGRLRQARDFRSMLVKQVRIGAHKRRLRVAKDGEVVRLRPPLRFALWPAALRVLAPPPAPADESPASII